MQDGGDEVKYGSNRVRYPVRPSQQPQPFLKQLEVFGKYDEQWKSEATFPKKVLCNERPHDLVSQEHKVHISKEFKISQLKQKCKKLGVSINDIFMGSLVKAIADLSAETGESKVCASMAFSVKSQDENLVRF